ncbi:MAG: hypothetical protein ACKVYV_10600 [Limisphaerales bacterium]
MMLWVSALGTLPTAGVFLMIGMIRARDTSAPFLRKFAGSALLLSGRVALGAGALVGTDISYWYSLPANHLSHQIQRPHEPPPGAAEWMRLIGCSLFAALLTGAGLGFWSGWPASRRLRCCAVILLFPLAARLLHRTLVAAGLLQLSA